MSGRSTSSLQPTNRSSSRTKPVLLLAAFFFWTFLGQPGCSKSSHESAKGGKAQAQKDAKDLTSAQELVHAFFKAVDEDDCRLIIANLTTGATMADCEDFVREWKGHSMQFLEILDAKRDGRNRNAIIVRVRVKGKKGTKVTLVRVVTSKGRWAVKL